MKQLMKQVKEHIAGYHLDDFWCPGWFVLFVATTVAMW